VSPVGVPLQTAAESVADAGRRAADHSGEVIDRHRGFVTTQSERLSNAGRTDTELEAQMGTAAMVTQAGARQMDAIAVQTRAIAEAAATAQTPAAQRAVLAALRSQVAQAGRVVNCTEQRAGEIAAGVRALNYRSSGQMR
jgi:hypothetical protein